jgi:hypothetical protein
VLACPRQAEEVIAMVPLEGNSGVIKLAPNWTRTPPWVGKQKCAHQLKPPTPNGAFAADVLQNLLGYIEAENQRDRIPFWSHTLGLKDR